MSDQYGYIDSDYDEDENHCDHMDADLDILDYRFQCSCGHSWGASPAQVEAEINRQREYSEWEERENRRQWWRDFYYTLTAPLRPIRRWWARRTYYDDGIPF